MNDLIRRIYKNLLIIFVFFIVIISSLFLFLYATDNLHLLNAKSFLNFDAEHYNQIRLHGYDEYQISFFPLFPFIWKHLTNGVSGILIFNILIFLLSFTFLSVVLNFGKKEIFLFLSFPSLIFMYLPYTESLFYLCGTILLMGYLKNKTWVICIGLFLCSMVRPASVVFVPALIITEWLSKTSIRIFINRSALCLACSLFGFFVVFAIHKYFIGNWFLFFKSFLDSSANFHYPFLPFTSWGGGTIVRLDGSALLIGLLTIFLIIRWYSIYIIIDKFIISKEKFFATLYIAGISILILSLMRSGSLFSLNRFVYATPFFTVFVHWFLKENKIKHIQLLYLFIGLNIFWLFFNSWVHIQTFLKFFLLSVYLICFLLIGNENKYVRNLTYYTCVILNIYFQVYFYFKFLNNEWIG